MKKKTINSPHRWLPYVPSRVRGFFFTSKKVKSVLRLFGNINRKEFQSLCFERWSSVRAKSISLGKSVMLLWASAVSNRHSSIPPSPSKKYILIFITYSYAFIRFSRIFFSLINQRLNQDDSTGGPTLASLIFRDISEYFIISFPH